MTTLRSTHRFMVKGHNVTAAMIAAFGTLIVVGVTVLVIALTSGGTSSVAPSHRGAALPPTSTPTNVARSIAGKYIAALDKLETSPLLSILDPNVVDIDWADGTSPFYGASALATNWGGVLSGAHWRGSLWCAAPTWAAVTWRWWGSANALTSKPFSTKGLSILDIKNGKIIRETIYWNVMGRNPGVAPTVGNKYAAALGKLQPRAITTLYSPAAVRVDASTKLRLGNSGHGIVGGWEKAFGVSAPTRWRGSLCCAGPRRRLDNGTMQASWVVVDWVWSSSTNPVTHKPVETHGVSILQIDKGKITRETVYYNQPGR